MDTPPGTGVPRVPRVSVAMPVYNGGADLRLAVGSVLAQSFAEWELLLIDDGSTDGAIDALDLADPRVRLIRDGSNQGLAARLNQAIAIARGEYFARMDADDVCHPERFARQVAFLDAHPEVDLLATRCVIIDGAGHVTGILPFAANHVEICARPWLSFPMPHPSWMGRTAWFGRHNYAFPAPYYCEDQELLLRTHATSRFAALPEALFAYRVSGRLPWRKLFRARRALFRVQVAWLTASGAFGSGLMVGVAMFLRVAIDGVRLLAGWRPTTRGLTTDEQAYWAAYIAGLALRLRGGDARSEAGFP